MSDSVSVSVSAAPFWLNPVEGVITSFGGLRENPITHEKEFHDGMDIACPSGSEVYATRAGKVLAAGTSPTYGHYVKLSFDDGYVAVYAHLQKALVEAGEAVELGQVVAYSGATGRATGPHLHYSVFKDGQYVNPALVVSLTPSDTSYAIGGSAP